MLFQDMSSQAPYTNVEVDLALKVLREEFLCLVLSYAIHEIPDEMTDDDTDLGEGVTFRAVHFQEQLLV